MRKCYNRFRWQEATSRDECGTIESTGLANTPPGDEDEDDYGYEGITDEFQLSHDS
jgi:hypothetical protein